MSQLADFLYPSPARRSAGGIVSWWEGRRLAYNALVGGAGLVTLSVTSVVVALPPFSESAFVPIQAVLIYGILANLMYTLGWVVELLAEKLFRGQLLPIGPVLYRMGLTFALGLTLLPAVVFTGVWLIAVVVTLLGLG